MQKLSCKNPVEETTHTREQIDHIWLRGRISRYAVRNRLVKLGDDALGCQLEMLPLPLHTDGCRSSCTLATPAEPEPINGSSTTPPLCVCIRTKCRNKPNGFWVG